MASDSLSSLNNQKESVKVGMNDTRDKISNAADKVSRLRKASSSLQTSIQSLRNLMGKIDDFEVAKGKWDGEEKESFEAKHNSYNIFVDVYDSDTSEAKEQIEEALEQAKSEKAQAEIGLENLQSALDGLDSDIKLAKED